MRNTCIEENRPSIYLPSRFGPQSMITIDLISHSGFSILGFFALSFLSSVSDYLVNFLCSISWPLLAFCIHTSNRLVDDYLLPSTCLITLINSFRVVSWHSGLVFLPILSPPYNELFRGRWSNINIVSLNLFLYFTARFSFPLSSLKTPDIFFRCNHHPRDSKLWYLGTWFIFSHLVYLTRALGYQA